MFSTMAVPIAALAILAGLLTWQLTRLLSLSRWVDHTSQVISDARAVERLMIGLEWAIQGQLLPGEDPFLEPWREAVRGIGPALEALAGEVADNPLEAQRVAGLRSGLAAWMQDARRAIDGRDRDVEAMAKRKDAMEDLRGQVGTILQTELSLRALRKQAAETNASLALGWSLAGTLLLGIGIGAVSRRQMLRLADLYESAVTTRELVLQSVGDGIYGLDRAGRITFMNPAGARLLGCEVADALGQDAHVLFHHSAADGRPYPAERCPINAAIRDGAVHRVEDEVFWRKDGSAFPVAYVSTPIRRPGALDGTLEGAVVSFRDVTLQRQREAERQRLLEQAAEGVRARDSILSVASHELLTPVTSIQMHADLLAKLCACDGDGQPRGGLRRHAEGCTRAVARLQRLVSELLDAASVHEHRIEVRRERVDMAQLVRGCVEDLEPQAGGARIRLHLDEGAVGAWDRRILERIVANLVTNALAFGKGAPVDISVHDEATRAVLEVRDHGEGVREEDRERIFSPLQHPDVSHHAQGLGLGLYVARGLAQAMGGDVTLAADAGPGARFRLVMPK
jgi:PAS domain S-box-containing protein